MQAYKYLVEFTGVIIIVYAKLLTDANPVVMGLTYFAVYFIAEHVTTGFFNPVSAISLYILGRVPMQETMYNVGVQLLGSIAAILTYSPLKVFIHDLD